MFRLIKVREKEPCECVDVGNTGTTHLLACEQFLSAPLLVSHANCYHF